eukprot:3942067-Prymnesium_polylepis.1
MARCPGAWSPAWSVLGRPTSSAGLRSCRRRQTRRTGRQRPPTTCRRRGSGSTPAETHSGSGV